MKPLATIFMRPPGTLLELFIVFSLLISGSGQGVAELPPAWWYTGSPPVISGTSESLAVSNVGQAKYMAKSALNALRDFHPPLAALIEADLVGSGKPIPSWNVPAPGSTEQKNNYAVLNVGQLKAISAPFYTRLNGANATWLAAERAANGTQDPASPAFIFPWTSNSADDANMNPASVGQMKAVFSLRFEKWFNGVDSDSDGLPNWWEILYGLNPNHPADANGDLVADGVTNLVKYKIGRNPSVVAMPDNTGVVALKVHTPLE